MTRMAKATRQYTRLLFGCLGCLCFAIGLIGVVLPGVPTTGPMLLALACFSRSSQRLHDWLFTHETFGPPLQRWKRDRTIPLRAKVFALLSMALSLAYLALFSSAPRAVVVVTALLMLIGASYILHCPHASAVSALAREQRPRRE